MRMELALVLLFVAVGAAMEERLFEDQEDTFVEKRSVVGKDILSASCCRYLKEHGFLASSSKLKKLCLTTFHCNDVFSNKSCHIAKAKKDCAKNSKLSLMYCRYTCNKCAVQTCIKSVALGMQSKAIPDSKITASSSYSSSYHPSKARLHMNSYGWTPTTGNRASSWMQIDLSSVATVTSIATQGSKKAAEWMKSYSLQYSLDGSSFKDYQAGKVFAGNTDQNTVVKHVLKPPIITRYFRVLPKSWKAWPSMRMELYGCK